jgi:hypothetical protein
MINATSEPTAFLNYPTFSLCIPTMDRYDQFLYVNLPKYINNPLIDEIIISDENGNDIRKIQQNFKTLDKFKFNINNKKKGAFYNKLLCCQLAKNEWIALIDSDNFADINYFIVANKFLNSMDKPIKKNIILAPDFAKPNFDYRQFSGMCFKKGNFQNIPNCKENSPIVMNTGNYILNKYLIEKIIFTNQDKLLINNSNACDVILFNTLLFEKLNLEMYIVPNLQYAHVIHNGSTYLEYCNKSRKTIDLVIERYLKLLK